MSVCALIKNCIEIVTFIDTMTHPNEKRQHVLVLYISTTTILIFKRFGLVSRSNRNRSKRSYFHFLCGNEKHVRANLNLTFLYSLVIGGWQNSHTLRMNSIVAKISRYNYVNAFHYLFNMLQ